MFDTLPGKGRQEFQDGKEEVQSEQKIKTTVSE